MFVFFGAPAARLEYLLALIVQTLSPIFLFLLQRPNFVERTPAS